MNSQHQQLLGNLAQDYYLSKMAISDISKKYNLSRYLIMKYLDEAFSSGALGQGVAILPSEGKLYAPCDGEVVTFFPTGHAIGMVSDGGAEILIHVGMDTVKLDGEGFTPKVAQGAKVKKGDLLLEFDIAKITGAGYSVLTPVIISNTADYADVVPTDAKKVAALDALITVL